MGGGEGPPDSSSQPAFLGPHTTSQQQAQQKAKSSTKRLASERRSIGLSKFRPGNPSNAGNNAIHHPQRRETFKIDASTAVNSQQERRIQLQGNSPHTTRTQEIQPRASVGSRPTPTRRCGRQNAGARRLAAHPKPSNRPSHIGPGLWTTFHRLAGESDRRHLSRGPMSAAIEQS